MIERLADLGELFRQFREAKQLSQEQLANLAGNGVNRSQVAHLEQGRRVPKVSSLRSLASVLEIPESVWVAFSREQTHQRQQFESALAELVGGIVVLRSMDLESVGAAEDIIELLFSGNLTKRQGLDTLNSALVFYGLPRMTDSFFNTYFTAAAFQSIEAFENSVHAFQKEAIRLFCTFGEAYRTMNQTGTDLTTLLGPLQPKSLEGYMERTVWESAENTRSQSDRVTALPEERLEFLGYISADKYKQQKRKRETLAKYLRELAADVRKNGAQAVAAQTEKRQRKLDSLMRELNSTLVHSPISPLFAPNPAELEAEAKRILRDEKDELAMEQAQKQALSNLSHYIAADYMDVYVATSMRTNSDFISANRFVQKLFRHSAVSPLRLRYFNPTQSWIEDRVAKGLVEALMLRRASVTLYMAQKSDSFGKDSEASVALGQGKPVIVYVPKLSLPSTGLDSEELLNSETSQLRDMIMLAGRPQEDIDELDHDGLFNVALEIRLAELRPEQMAELVNLHWADFALFDETERIRGSDEASRREAYTQYITGIVAGLSPDLKSETRVDLEKILQAVTTTFELKRARVFREVHPLALQIILSTGVLNGILVCRTIDSCAKLLRGLLENRLDLKLQTDSNNYRLVEETTKSTIRVIPRNNLLSNALDVIYGRT